MATTLANQIAKQLFNINAIKSSKLKNAVKLLLFSADSAEFLGSFFLLGGAPFWEDLETDIVDLGLFSFWIFFEWWWRFNEGNFPKQRII